MKTLKFLLTISCFIFSQIIFAQNKHLKDSTYLIETVDGNSFTGELKVLEPGRLYQLKTSNGTLTFKKTEIKFMKSLEVNDLHKGSYWPDNPHSSRYFFQPSGYGLRKGEGYYQNAWILLNQFSYGITNNFSMGVGIIPLFLFGYTGALPVWLTPKVNFNYKNNRGAFGVGTILFSVIGPDTEGGTGSIGILYGSNTFGTRDKQLSVGIGLGYASGYGFAKYPTLSLGGLNRFSKNWAFVSENYLLVTGDGSLGILSAGLRYMGRRLAIDFGGFIFVSPEFDGSGKAPWLSITVPFGTRY